MITQQDAIASEPQSLAELREFMRLPIDERRRILAQQADLMVDHYEQTSLREEREMWQGGDIVEL